MINYEIKTEGFVGPLDLLLRLVDREELDITRLSLAKVADDFLGEMESREIELAELAEFLLIASQLILIKSKALLPFFEFTQEEEEEIGDLEARLKEYRAFKKASLELQAQLAMKKVFFSREENEKKESLKKFIDPKISLIELKELWEGVLEKNAPKEKMEERIMEKVVTLEDRISHLKFSLEKRIKMAFKESVKGATDKIEVVVTFLAMLEMVKRKIIFASQECSFGEIILTKHKNFNNQKDE